MNCDICNKWIKHKKNWIRHCKTKGHKKRENEQLNNNLNNNPNLQNNNISNTNNNPNNNNNNITPQNNNITPQNNNINTQNNNINNTQKTTGEQPENNQKQPENNQKQQEKNQGEYYGYCKYCNKGLKYQQSLSRHQKNCKQRHQHQSQGPSTINNNTTNNIDNTTNNTQVINQIVVQVNVRGQEDFTKCITIESLEDLRALTGAELLTTVASQFFGTDENKSIACPNIKHDFGIVKRIEGPRTEYIPPVLKTVIDRLPEDLKDTMISIINMARENGYYKEKNRYAIDDKKLVMEIYNEMIKACKNPKERKIVEKSLKALFHNNKLLTKEAKEDI